MQFDKSMYKDFLTKIVRVSYFVYFVDLITRMFYNNTEMGAHSDQGQKVKE